MEVLDGETSLDYFRPSLIHLGLNVASIGDDCVALSEPARNVISRAATEIGLPAQQESKVQLTAQELVLLGFALDQDGEMLTQLITEEPESLPSIIDIAGGVAALSAKHQRILA